MRALVVDDSRAMRMILRKVLIESGFDVVEADHGKSALDRLKETGPVDLATVDWNMPEMGGLEFVEAVRANDANAKMLLMMVTTETEFTMMQKALDAGANEYLMKPFTREGLLDKLEIMGLRNG